MRERAHDRMTSRMAARIVAIGLVGLIGACALVGCAESAPRNTATSAQYSTTVDLTNEINTSQLPDSSFLYDASIADLANATSYMNGQTVQVTGEVVGDRITAEYDPAFCWLTLQETGGSYAEISVYLPKTMTTAIDTYGAYGRQGTILQVRGTFNLACRDHNGASCLHATNSSKVAPGKALDIAPDKGHLSVGLVVLVMGLAMLFAHHKLREREL